MAGIPEALEQVRSALHAALDLDPPRGLGDDELLVAMGALEGVGRLLDAHRATFAGEVAERSRVELGAGRLSTRKGCRSAAELIERVTQVSGTEARRRVSVGRATLADTGLTGQPVPAAHPHVAAALVAGSLGLDAAATIVRELGRTRTVADPTRLAVAERELVDQATGTGDAAPVRASADELAVQARAWAAFLDQDGPEPDDERAMRRRGFRVGRARDGLIPITGELLPEVAAKLKRLLDAHLSPRSGGGFLTDAEHADLAVQAETRTTEQQRHDVLAAIIDTAARSGEHPSIGGAAPTVLVSVRAADLEAGSGAGHADGAELPISLRAVRHMVCTGGIQTVVSDDMGRIIRLGSPERCFTPHQRRAITLRDGGCLIPGCTVPAAWCEIHHVVPDAYGGPTHTDNGVLLCWFHHRTIDSSGWGIRMRRGVPEIRPPGWLDPGGRWRATTTSPTRIADRLELDHAPPERKTA
ncbi:hypothetical protein JOE59_003348 [Agromyces cerinus]|uniref:HNH endonuclease signature motif containing protein n=1 Tax=Agromyces cerinus TaxID=33878 RepID=UPI00195B9099|nr:HNH endonuclease signature motif containing protein [Agromyces cerinus]MBM7832643.1 hypothetical protein [Agromyces cerinus]